MKEETNENTRNELRLLYFFRIGLRTPCPYAGVHSNDSHVFGMENERLFQI